MKKNTIPYFELQDYGKQLRSVAGSSLVSEIILQLKLRNRNSFAESVATDICIRKDCGRLQIMGRLLDLLVLAPKGSDLEGENLIKGGRCNREESIDLNVFVNAKTASEAVHHFEYFVLEILFQRLDQSYYYQELPLRLIPCMTEEEGIVKSDWCVELPPGRSLEQITYMRYEKIRESWKKRVPKKRDIPLEKLLKNDSGSMEMVIVPTDQIKR